MPEGVDNAAAAFQQAIDPAQSVNDRLADGQLATGARDDILPLAQFGGAARTAVFSSHA